MGETGDINRKRKRRDTRFKPGVASNPKGRPKKTQSVTMLMRDVMNWPAKKMKDLFDSFETKTFKIPEDQRTYWMAATLRAIELGVVKGSERMLTELINRMDGRIAEEPRISTVTETKDATDAAKDPFQIAAEVITLMSRRGMLPKDILDSIKTNTEDGGAPGDAATVYLKPDENKDPNKNLN